jgi:hypothetical protein
MNEQLEDSTEVKTVTVDPEERVEFQLSNKFLQTMEPIAKEYKVGAMYFSLKDGMKRKYLAKDPVNYIDIDDEGNISFLKSRYFTEPDPWKSNRRVKTKATKALREIFNEQYINTEIKQTDIEAFANKLATLKSSGLRVEEFRGEDVLRGYNYKHEFNTKFGHSCANFNQKELNGGYREPWVDEYDVYVKNPENCGVVVVWDEGKIVARRSFQQGIQVCDVGDWKKGEHHTVWGNAYGIGGSGGRYDTMITDYLKKKYKAVQKGYSPGFCVHMETRWKNYPAFDSMYVNFDHNLLTDNYGKLPNPFNNYDWKNTYPSMDHLHAPQRYIDMRLQEEAEKSKPVQPELEPIVQAPPIFELYS